MKFLPEYLIILCGVVVSCHGKCTNGYYEEGVNEEEKNNIVEYHNKLRKELANGEVPGQPRAVNLKRMHWDETLAQDAQDIANTCNSKHVSVTDSRWKVGQNLAADYLPTEQPHANWTSAISRWWDERTVYTYPNQFSMATGDFTQMAWDDTQYIGCGYINFPVEDDKNPYRKLYVCNYGPAGNFPRAPYKTGEDGCEDLC